MARTILIHNCSFKPPKKVAHVQMDDYGNVSVVSASPAMRKTFDRGVLEWPSREHVKPEAGERFMNALLEEFGRGTYIRSEEVKD